MTRKHFETIAISIGFRLRDYPVDSPEWNAVMDTASAIASDLRIDNPRFDPQRFQTFILDVAEYRRDLDGMKVTA